ncbi:hypothetical protein PISL3812_09311 [Talaromyces islandicus]|uniref:Uncharacterized protein n=1 Tax=Talaromyces islandicus TaxID=28573 RepID=A0A0U1M9C9_TALIS|nr:hypothetical protein PISL3812_09311 [Talaromyces islandicus]
MVAKRRSFVSGMDSAKDDTEVSRMEDLQLEESGLSGDDLDDLPDKEPKNSSKSEDSSHATRKPAAASGTCSLTWVSAEAKERDHYRKMRLNMEFIAPKSPFVPSNFKKWLLHRASVLEARARSIKNCIADSKGTEKGNAQLVFHERKWSDTRSHVLSQETIWRNHGPENPSRPQAPWPDSSERKHEGYQRVRSGYKRFLPLPRVPGNQTVNWKQRSPIATYEFDRVGQPIGIGMTVEIDETMEECIGRSFLAGIDNLNFPK